MALQRVKLAISERVVHNNKALAIIRNQSITVTTQTEGESSMSRRELSPYAPDRWIRELNRRYDQRTASEF